MNYLKQQLFTALFIASSLLTFAQVGIGTTTPEGALDVVSVDSGFILPRVATTAAITTPVNGMLIFDLSSTCAKSYENGAWTDCLSANDDDDRFAYVYRQGQQTLVGQKAADVRDGKGHDIFKTNHSDKETLLVFVGRNTPISLEILQQLDSEVATAKNTNVVSVLLGSTNESLQNFKSRFPNWSHYSIEAAEQIEKIAEAYKLVFAPTVFLLDSERTIQKQLGVFESIMDLN